MKKAEIIMILITAVFIMILTGFFIGRLSKDGTMNVYTQKTIRSETFLEEENRPSVLININTASSEELQDLPGIGPATAEAIIAYRQDNGPFEYKQDLMNVDGIGEKTYQELKSMITVKGNE